MTAQRENQLFFEQAITGLLNALYGTALRLTKNPGNAEDLVAETVSKAWEKLHTLQQRACFRVWIFRILTNTFISDYRQRIAAPTLYSLSDTLDVDAETDAETEEFSLFEKLHQPFLLWWDNPEQNFLNKLLREDMEHALARLPEAFCITLMLADIEGFTYPEIAKMLKLPVGTVRSRLARARALMQKALWQHACDRGLVGKPAVRAPQTSTLTLAVEKRS